MKEIVTGGGEVAFNMQLEALEFMSSQEWHREVKETKKRRQRSWRSAGVWEGDGIPLGPSGGGTITPQFTMKVKEEEECSICPVGKSMERFVVEGLNHMEWNNEKESFHWSRWG